MDTELAEGKLGTVGHYDIDFKDKQLVLAADAAIGLGSVGVVVKVDAEKVWDAMVSKITAAIPGTYDDMIFSVMKAALLGK